MKPYRNALTAILTTFVAAVATPAEAQVTDTLTIGVFGAATTIELGDDCTASEYNAGDEVDVILPVGVPRTCTITGRDDEGRFVPITLFATSTDSTVARVDSVTAVPGADRLPGSVQRIHLSTVGVGLAAIVIETQPITQAMGIMGEPGDPDTFAWMTRTAEGTWCRVNDPGCATLTSIGDQFQLCWYHFTGSFMARKSSADCPFDAPVMDMGEGGASGPVQVRQAARVG